MTKPAFTPGPWRAMGCEIVADTRVIATVHWCGGLELEDDANARLVAAAPDMYEALELAILVLEALPEDDESLYGPRALTLARAALAKARAKP